ncbi:MAG: SHOCT domain-containing protein [Methylococcus sp.]
MISAMRYSTIAVFLSALVSCGITSPIKKINESESAFSDDPAKRVKPIKGNPEIYRIYDRAATGFVSIGATREGLEERAGKFCESKGKQFEELASEQSNPPYILGNFPRMELIFICKDKAVTLGAPPPMDKFAKLNELKKLLDNGTLNQTEFDMEKQKILAGQ